MRLLAESEDQRYCVCLVEPEDKLDPSGANMIVQTRLIGLEIEITEAMIDGMLETLKEEQHHEDMAMIILWDTLGQKVAGRVNVSNFDG